MYYSGIYSSNFDVHYMAQKNSVLQWSFETQSLLHIFLSVCLFVFVFAYLLSYWTSFAVTILALKIKRYVHVLYMQLCDYLSTHNITYITYLHIQKIKIKP